MLQLDELGQMGRNHCFVAADDSLSASKCLADNAEGSLCIVDNLDNEADFGIGKDILGVVGKKR